MKEREGVKEIDKVRETRNIKDDSHSIKGMKKAESEREIEEKENGR